MEAVGDDRPSRNGTLHAVDAEQARGAEHGQALEVVVPEVDVVRQCVERREQGRDFAIRILLPQRFLECPDQIPEADRILLSLRKLPMSRLVQGQTGTFVRLENLLWVVVRSEAHTSELQSIMRKSYAD